LKSFGSRTWSSADGNDESLLSTVESKLADDTDRLTLTVEMEGELAK
jgi:hypothetical protein